MIYYSIKKYQSGVKVIKPFDRKIAQIVYFQYMAIYSHDYTNIDDRYVYTDVSTII